MMIFKEWGRQRKAVNWKWLHVSSSETEREAQEVRHGKYTYFGGEKKMVYIYEKKENWAWLFLTANQSLHFILQDIVTFTQQRFCQSGFNLWHLNLLKIF